jgi:hypothetical protein
VEEQLYDNFIQCYIFNYFPIGTVYLERGKPVILNTNNGILKNQTASVVGFTIFSDCLNDIKRESLVYFVKRAWGT